MPVRPSKAEAAPPPPRRGPSRETEPPLSPPFLPCFSLPSPPPPPTFTDTLPRAPQDANVSPTPAAPRALVPELSSPTPSLETPGTPGDHIPCAQHNPTTPNPLLSCLSLPLSFHLPGVADKRNHKPVLVLPPLPPSPPPHVHNIALTLGHQHVYTYTVVVNIESILHVTYFVASRYVCSKLVRNFACNYAACTQALPYCYICP